MKTREKESIKKSGGIPRLINLISSRAIMAAFVSGNAAIRKNHVDYAIEHLSDEPASGKFFAYSGYAALTIILVMAIVFGIYKVSANVPEIIDVNKPQNEKAGSVISKKTTRPGAGTSQTARTKTENLPQKTSVSKFQAQKTKYPAEALPAAEATNKVCLQRT